MEVLNRDEEKRKCPRLLIDLPVEYRMTDGPDAYGGIAVNGNEAGLLLRSVKNMPIGTKLKITVLFATAFQLINFEALGEIIWKDLHWEEDWDGYKYGLKFILIEGKELQKFRSLLAANNIPFV